MTLRPFIFWPHLIAGAIAGAIILLMSVTGVLLTYERQLVAWSDRSFRSVPQGNASPLPPAEFLSRWIAAHPDLTPVAITLGAAADAPVIISVPPKTMYADAYTANLLGESALGVRRFMSTVRAWHRWLAVDGDGRPLARAVTGWANLVFLFIVISGLYLWLPRTWGWRQLKANLLFAGRATGKARDFNWHHVIGIWSAIPLVIIVASAVPMSFPWANALVYRAVGEEAPAGGRDGGPGRAGGARRSENRGEQEQPSFSQLDALTTRAKAQVAGWSTINIRIPASAAAPVAFAIDRGDGGQPQLRSTLTLDSRTGAVIRHDTFSDLTLGRRIRNVMRFAHTGEVLGVAGQTVAGVASAGATVLVWTGLSLAWRRARAAIARRGPISTPARSGDREWFRRLNVAQESSYNHARRSHRP